MRRTVFLALSLAYLSTASPCCAHQEGAVPGPPITGKLVAMRGGCPEQEGSITVAIGEWVHFETREVGDMDYVEDPSSREDSVHLENWQFPGAHDSYPGNAVWHPTGTYVVSVDLVDDHIYADDNDRTVSISVNVEHSVGIGTISSTDGLNFIAPVGGNMWALVSWIGPMPTLRSAENTFIHGGVESNWGMVDGTLSDPCTYPRTAIFRWRTPSGLHNGSWTVTAESRFPFTSDPGGPASVVQDQEPVTLANLATENVSPEILKHDPDDPGGGSRTVTGLLADAFSVNPDVQRTTVTLRVYPLNRTLYTSDLWCGTQVVQAPGQFQIVWNGRNRYDGELPKGVYPYRLSVEQFFPEDPLFHIWQNDGAHADQCSNRSTELDFWSVGLSIGDYDKETKKWPYEVRYSFVSLPFEQLEPNLPEWAIVDIYDPDFAVRDSIVGPALVGPENVVSGTIRFDKDGPWSFVVTALDQGQDTDKLHTQRLVLQSGGSYEREMPVIRLTHPDPALSPHNAPPANEYCYEDSSNCPVHGAFRVLDIPARAAVVSGNCAAEIAWETDWQLSSPPPNQLPRVWPNGGGSGEVYALSDCSEPGWPFTIAGLRFLHLYLPASNGDFGNRTVTLTGGGMVAIQGDSTADIQIFYPGGDFSHPPGEPEGHRYLDCDHTTPTPNWFYYYSQVHPDALVRWTDGLASYYYPGQDHVHIGPEPTGCFEQGVFVLDPGDQWVHFHAREKSCHIDLFRRVTEHEKTHKSIWEGSDPNNDSDGDGLEDQFELDLHLDPGTPYTTTAGFDDQEVVCHIVMRGVFGDVTADWAWPGWQVGADPDPNAPEERIEIGVVPH